MSRQVAQPAQPLLQELWQTKAWRLFPLLFMYMTGEWLSVWTVRTLNGTARQKLPWLPPAPLLHGTASASAWSPRTASC
jgi:hypothetical protein